MKKYSILIGLLLFLGFVTPAHADTSVNPISNPSSYTTGDGDTWTNPTNMTALDGSNATCTGNNDCGHAPAQFSFGTNSIPAHMDFTGVVLTIRGSHSGGGGGLTGFINANGSPTTCSGGHLGGTANLYPFTATGSTATYTITIPAGFVTTADINSGNFCISPSIGNNSGGTWTIDYMAAKIAYQPSLPSLAITNLIATAGAQKVYFSASGDTKFTQAGEQCKISLYEFDITDPSSPQIVSAGVAYVLLDASNPRTTTLSQGQSTYLGYGFTSSVSTWAADNISMPYFNAKNTDIRAYTSCYHQTTNSDGSLSAPQYDLRYQALSSTLGNSSFPYAGTLIATPSALQNVQTYAQPQCTTLDIICQVTENVQNTLISLFAPNQQLNNEAFSSVNDAMLAHAPFAYGLALLNTDTSISTVASNSATSLSFDFSHISGVAIPTQYQHMSYTDTGSIRSNIYAPFRPYEVIILYVFLLLYLVWVLRSIFI